MNFSFKTFILSLCILALTGCGGGSGDSTQTEMPTNQQLRNDSRALIPT